MRKVKIKTWEKMEREFGLNCFKNINILPTFNKVMENQMPQNRIILVEKKNIYFWWRGWEISEDMIECDIAEESEKQNETKEYQVGEVFEYEGKKYKCVKAEDNTCGEECVFNIDGERQCNRQVTGLCGSGDRKQKDSVHFIEITNEKYIIAKTKPTINTFIFDCNNYALKSKYIKLDEY